MFLLLGVIWEKMVVVGVIKEDGLSMLINDLEKCMLLGDD
jgi:hypothetical protein